MLVVLPQHVLNSETDWLSLTGNVASLAGLLFSFVGLLMTISVKRQVKKIEREYVMRLQSGEWVTRLDAHAEKLYAIYGFQPYSPENARVEVARLTSLVESFPEQVPEPFQKNVAAVLKKIENRQKARWLRKAKPLSGEELFDLYVVLVTNEMSIDNKALDTVLKLLQLTAKGELEWGRITDTGLLTSGTDDLVLVAYTTSLAGTRFALYERRFRNMNMEVDESMFWDDRVVLQLIDDEGRPLWAFPAVQPLRTLYARVSAQAAGVEERLDKILDYKPA